MFFGSTAIAPLLGQAWLEGRAASEVGTRDTNLPGRRKLLRVLLMPSLMQNLSLPPCRPAHEAPVGSAARLGVWPRSLLATCHCILRHSGVWSYAILASTR